MALAIEQATLGSLILDRPERARLLEKFGLDYCCGGKRTLEEACKAKGLNLKEIISALDEFDKTNESAAKDDVAGLSLSALIDHIISTHHVYMKEALPHLSMLSQKVANRHSDKDPNLKELASVYAEFFDKMVSHLMKEERILFPMLLELSTAKELPSFHCGSVQNPIRVMFAEHDDAGEDLRRMRELTQDYALPEHACNSYRALFAGLAEMERDIHMHVHKENNILFEKALKLEESLRRSQCDCA